MAKHPPESDPTKDPAFRKVVGHFLNTPPKPHTPPKPTRPKKEKGSNRRKD